jgi:hypothetical protein
MMNKIGYQKLNQAGSQEKKVREGSHEDTKARSGTKKNI